MADSTLPLRVAARYYRAVYETAMEHATPEALREYLHEHPNADPRNHHVKKHEHAGGHPEEHAEGHPKEHAEAPKKSWKERMHSLSAKAKSFLSNAPSEIKKFVSDDTHRRGVLLSMHKSLVNLPKKAYENAKHAVKHEVKEYKEAVSGIKAVLKGGKMTREQKKAVKVIAFDVALTVATVCVTGGLAAGAKGVAAKTAHSFTTALAKKLAMNAVTDGLGNLVTVEELGHFGHGVAHTLHHVLTAAEKDEAKGDDRDLVVAYITKIVADQVKDMDPDIVADALDEVETA
jgi:hypothetical protein